MIIIEENKNRFIDNVNIFESDGLNDKTVNEKREYFQRTFSKEMIKNLSKENYFQGLGKKEGNFTYELEWNSQCLGSIRGGSVYKFGYQEDFGKIKDFILKIISANSRIDQFYTPSGDLTEFSKKLINEKGDLKGISRVLVGKILSIYYPEIFIPLFGDQDRFLKKLYRDYEPEDKGIELYLRNNFELLEIKKKYCPGLSNDEFVSLLYKTFGTKQSEIKNLENAEETQIDALEVEHYQSLIHRNFKKLFDGKLRYYDPEYQKEHSGHFDTQEVGIMDFLAVDNEDNLVVIELKRNSTDKTLGQILRYMGWVKENLLKSGKEVKGIILAESKDNRTEYALKVTHNVKFNKMTLKVDIEK